MKPLSENKSVFFIILLIATIYLFPALLGKVDTPLDIRNKLIYPWSYHYVDKKIKTTELWKAQPQSINIDVFPNSQKSVQINLNNIKKINNNPYVVYYFIFDFKAKVVNPDFLKFGVNFVNKSDKSVFYPNVQVTGSKVYVPLKEFLREFNSIEKLNDYNLQLIVNNFESKTNSFQVKDLKLVCEDYSNTLKIHNPFLDDLIQWFTPAREYFSNSLKTGKIPFWNNYILTGTEFLSEPQVGFFHPFYFLTYLIFDHFTAHSIITFISFFLCGFGTFLLTKYWGLGFYPSLLSSIVYMFHPFNVVWFSFEHVLMISATLPFLLLNYDKALDEKNSLNRYLLISASLLGLIFSSGHLQIVYYAVIFFILFASFKFIESIFLKRTNHFKHFVSFFFTFVIALMIGSIVLIPFSTLFLNSHRIAISEDMIKMSSVRLDSFKGLIYPFYRENFVNEYVYFGFIPFVLSLFTIKTLFDRKVKKLLSILIFLFISIAVSLLISTGSPLFFLVKSYILGFSQLQHYRFLIIYSFCVPFLAGIGSQVFLDSTPFIKENIKKVLVLIILLYTAFDLIHHSSYFVSWSSRCEYKPIYKGGIEFLLNAQKNSKEPFRVTPITFKKVGETAFKANVVIPNTLQPYCLEDPSGYSSFIPKDIYNLFIYLNTKDPSKLYKKEILKLYSNFNIPYSVSNFQSMILDLLNVKYFIIPPIFELLSSDVKKVFSGDCNIYENLDYLPRAFIVPGFKVIESPVETIIKLDSSEFDPRREVILMTARQHDGTTMARQHDGTTTARQHDGTTTARQHDGTTGNIEFLKYEPNNIKLKVKTNSPGFLVLGQNFTNNWKVKVNNKEDKLLQANLVQRAIYLPKAGNYLVEFYYFPKLFLIGFLISGTAVLIIISLAIWLRLRKPTY